MANLTKIQIKNYRSIKDSGEIPITKLFALIGRNNTGKSTVLKAIRLLFADKEMKIEDSDFHMGTTDPIEIEGTIEWWKNDEKTEKVVRLVCEKGKNPTYLVDGAKKPATGYPDSVPSLLVIPDRRDDAEFNTKGQKTSLLKRILNERRVKDDDALANISKQLEAAKRAEAQDISKLLTSKFHEIAKEQTFEVRVEPDIDVEKSATHTSTLVDNDIPNAPIVGMTECGTGIQSMYLLALLDTYGDISGKSDEGILLIEEPEVYLHPDYQHRMFQAMRKIATDNQVIFSTHSPIMVSEIWQESVRQVRLIGGETKIEEMKIEDVISELGIKYEDVLNPKLTLFVEGPNDIEFYKNLGIDSAIAIKYIPTDGFDAMQYFAYMKILSSMNVSSDFFIIADSDGCEPEERREKLRGLTKKKFKDLPNKLRDRIDTDGAIYVLEKYSVESYFLTYDTLHAAFPEIAEDNLRNFIAHYDAVYAEELKNMRDSSHARTHQEFKRYARPKLIFDESDKGEATEGFKTRYASFWKDDANFLTVRGQILDKCKTYPNADGGWFKHVLSHTDLTQVTELTTMRDQIMAST